MIKKHYINQYTVTEYNNSNIYVIEDILTDNFCEIMIDLINKLPSEKIVHGDNQNVECYISYFTELLKKNDEPFYLFSTNKNENNKIITNNMNGFTNTQINNYNQLINSMMILIQRIMNKVDNSINWNDQILFNSGYNLRKIWGETRLHIDNIFDVYTSGVNSIYNYEIQKPYKMVRNVSIIFALNDDYDGGKFYFPYQDVELKLKKNSVILFPPYWTHPHKVSALLNGTFRYTINTWSVKNV
jgi:hypothetical protein